MKDEFQQSKFRYTNEAVGLFVLMALLIFIAGLIYSGRVREWFNPGETLRVVLPDEGLSGLTRGSTVVITSYSIHYTKLYEMAVHKKQCIFSLIGILPDVYSLGVFPSLGAENRECILS